MKIPPSTLLFLIFLACPGLFSADTPPPRLPSRLPELQTLNIPPEKPLDPILVGLFEKVELAESEQNLEQFKTIMSQIFQHCINKKELEYREIGLWSALTLGLNLASEDNFKSALVVIDNSIDSFKNDQTKSLMPLILQTYWTRTSLLLDLKDWTNCIAASEKLYEMAQQTDVENSKDAIAASLLFKISALEQNQTPKNLILECNKILCTHKLDKHPKILGISCLALYQQGVAQVKINQLKDALVSFETMYETAKNSNDLVLMRIVALSIFTKGGALELMGRNTDAKKTFQELVDTYKNLSDPVILELSKQASDWIKMHKKTFR